MVINTNDLNSLIQSALPICMEVLREKHNITNVSLVPSVGSPLYIEGSNGIPCPVFLNFDPEIGFTTILNGQWDFHNIENVVKILEAKEKVNLSLIDVGANIGLFTRQLIIATKHHTHIEHIFCFEPHPTNFALLRQNLSAWSNLQLNNFALADTNGHSDFFIDARNSGNYSLSHEAMEGGKYHKISIPVNKAGEEITEIMKITESPFIYKSDTQGFDQKIACDFPLEFWNKVHCGIFELWRLPNNEYDEDTFCRVLESFEFLRFGNSFDRNVTPPEIISYLKGSDGTFDDLYVW